MHTPYLLFTLLLLQQNTQQLAQLPQYAVGPMINVHPFITHVYIAVPNTAVRAAMGTILCTSAALDFVRDNDIYTDWKVRLTIDIIHCQALVATLRLRHIVAAYVCIFTTYAVLSESA
jgi:hypothetical protein